MDNFKIIFVRLETLSHMKYDEEDAEQYDS